MVVLIITGSNNDFLASLSAISLPGIPIWEGIHSRHTLKPLFFLKYPNNKGFYL